MVAPVGGTDGSERLILLRAARDLVAEARSERSVLSADSPERQFYLGVEAAAQDVLHPELGASRDAGWLARHAPKFRDAYVQTSTLLAEAATAADPPVHVPMPTPPPAR